MPRRMRWLLVLVVVAMGCGGGTLQLPSRGGAPWVELRSEHFRLWTNAKVERGRELIVSLEERRQVIARAMNRVEQAAEILVIATQTAEELAAFLGPTIMGMAWRKSHPTHQPGIVMSAAASEHSEVVMNHEVAHAISHALITDQPRWFAEGLASYFELATLDPKTRIAKIGVPRGDLLRVLRSRGPMSTRKIFACPPGDCISDHFYVSSWALFSYLLNKHFERFGTYLQQLQLTEGDQDKAWSAAFPGVQMERFDDQLWDWAQSGQFAVPRIKVEVRPYPAVERRLGEADALAARSILSYSAGRRAASREDAAAALALDRTHVLAWAMMSRAHKKPPSVAESRALAEAHPEDWRTWQFLYFALKLARGPEEETKAVRERMCAMAAKEGNPCRRQEESSSEPASTPSSKPTAQPGG
jgi:Protein of unknown function (DUF1570)